MKTTEIITAIRPLGWPDTKARQAAWLRSGRNFVAARKAAIAVRGVGPKAWRAFIGQYGLGEEWLPAEYGPKEETLSWAKIGTRVQAGEGEDHDTGRIDAIDGNMATVAWDSGVVTPAPLSILIPLSR